MPASICARRRDKELVELLAERERLVRPPRPAAAAGAGRRQASSTTARTTALAKIAFEHKDETRRLRGLWALHVTGGLDRGATATRRWTTAIAYVRAWAIQLAPGERQAVRRLAASSWRSWRANDPSPVVRLYLASGAAALAAGEALGRSWKRCSRTREDAERPQPAADVLVRRRAAGRRGSRHARSTWPRRRRCRTLLPFMVRRIGVGRHAGGARPARRARWARPTMRPCSSDDPARPATRR